MARPRIRTIKPELWQDEKIGALHPWERLLYIGCITMADDLGRLRLLPASIGGFVFPYDEVPPAKIRRWLGSLDTAGLVRCYEAVEHEYVQIIGWLKHQRIEKSSGSELPPCPGLEAE